MDLGNLYGRVDVTWMDDAACADIENKEIFFPPRDKKLYSKIAAEAKTYCKGPNGNKPCPVQKQCLIYAIESDEMHGIWGGYSHRERNAIVRKWQKQYKHEMTLREYILKKDTRD